MSPAEDPQDPDMSESGLRAGAKDIEHNVEHTLVVVHDFMVALRSIHSSVDQKSVLRYDQWDAKFGTGGGCDDSGGGGDGAAPGIE